jgi:hypothetical protein
METHNLSFSLLCSATGPDTEGLGEGAGILHLSVHSSDDEVVCCRLDLGPLPAVGQCTSSGCRIQFIVIVLW